MGLYRRNAITDVLVGVAFVAALYLLPNYPRLAAIVLTVSSISFLAMAAASLAHSIPAGASRSRVYNGSRCFPVYERSG